MNSTLSKLQNLSYQTHSHVYGCESPLSLAVFLGVYEKEGPHVISMNEALFDEFEETLCFFNPHLRVHKLPYTDLTFPSRKIHSDRLSWLQAARQSSSYDVFLVSEKSLLQKTIPLEEFKKHSLKLSLGSELPSERKWAELGYLEAIKVEEQGFYTQKGLVLDIFSPAYPYPIRCETKGSEIQSLRFFDPSNYRSIEEISEAYIIPSHEVLFASALRSAACRKIRAKYPKLTTEQESFIGKLSKALFFPEVIQFLPFFYEKEACVLDFFEQNFFFWKFPTLSQEEANDSASELFFNQIPDPATQITMHSLISEDKNIWPISILPPFKSKPSFLNLRKKYLFISVPSKAHEAPLKLQFEKEGLNPQLVSEEEKNWASLKEQQSQDSQLVHFLSSSLPTHLSSEDSYYLKGDQLLGKTYTPVQRKIPYSSKASSFSFSEIDIGDLVIDRTHGVCTYKGLQKIQLNNQISEFVELEFKDKDKLYVPITELHRLFRMKTSLLSGSLDRLGSINWSQKISKAGKSIQTLVLELMRIYSLRSQVQRKPFSQSTPDLEQFEKDFPYQETPDQITSIQAVFKDMLGTGPMDRLIIGDSGYGKTEVSMRAAFKAVGDGYQVVMLAPTTILSLQHFNSFKERFAKWPMRVELLNRLVPTAKAKSIIQDLGDHKIDIIIGSHRLLSSDIHFKKLGLIIIDEEHRFGVRQKEKLKKINAQVDCIYMSATPIPRTLNMSLNGAKDISVIHTPPKNRIPPKVFIIPFAKEKIKEAIKREIQRGGQVIFVHNKIYSLDRIYQKLQGWFPDAVIRMAHGQMKETELESHVLSFFNHKADILLCTTIIETGMDFARAHTIIIDEAQNLGLSQLYQLRGRVGRRAHIQSYCYFVVPEHLDDASKAIQRLNFLQTHNEKSSGYQVARYDLELRGGGDFLGAKQTGHIQNIGYDLFLEMLEDNLNSNSNHKMEPEINLPWEARIPDDYMPQEKIRLMYYKYLSSFEDIDQIPKLEEELRDGFGPLPEELNNLIGQVMIRHECYRLRIKELSLRKDKLSFSFFDLTTGSFKKVKTEVSDLSSWAGVYNVLKNYQIEEQGSFKI